MPPPITRTTNIFSTPQFKDAYDHRPAWAVQYSRTEYYDHISAKGWTPEDHARLSPDGPACDLSLGGTTIILTDRDRDDLIREAEETGLCPACKAEMKCESSHERDSTHDGFSCPACGWSYSQQEAWAAERVP